MKNLLPFLLLVSLFCFISCDDVDPFEIDDVDFGDPQIGVPLINSTFYISDLSVDSDDDIEVIVDNDKRVTLQYFDKIKPVPVSDVFPIVNDKTTIVESNPFKFELPFNDIDIRKGFFKNSSLKISITNPTNEDLTVELFIPQISNPLTGLLFNQSYTIKPNEKFVSADISWNEWTVETDDGSLELTYFARTSSNQNVNIDELSIYYHQLDFTYLEGIFKQVKYPLAEELIDVSFFDNWVSGGLNLSDPKLIFNVQNSVGVSGELILNHAEITTIDNEVFELENEPLQEGVSFDYPGLSEVGSTKSTSIQINSDNSNVKNLFDKKPSAIDYDVELLINPQNNDEIGFYSDQSYINVDAVVELPLNFRANDLILQDEFAFEEITYDQIDSTGELRLDLINAFPIGVSMNLYFLDEDGTQLFQLVDDTDWISAEASEDPTKTVDELESQIINIPIAEDDLQKLPLIRNVQIKVLITTNESFGDDYVWVYEHHGVDIKLGAVLR